MKILIVDDSKAMRMIVARTLRQAGFEGHDITEATNGAEAFAAIMADTPDLVLSDWNMPEMNGIDLLRVLRANGVGVCFGFVTSESTPEMQAQAREQGAQFVVGKPFTPEAFQQALSPVLT
jgi:two-component system chemotaxis response regulator CheY